MKIALVQTAIVPLCPAANMLQAEQLMNTMPDADVYVLPETWSTGFCTEPGTPWPDADEALRWMKNQAALRQAALVGSLVVNSADGLKYNRLYFVRPDGSTTHYDKRHLFAYGGEDRCFLAGKQAVVAEWKGVRFMLQICFDLRFPESARNRLSLPPYDVLVYVANWPASRRKAWDALLPARAIENQVYVVGVNRAGYHTAENADASSVYDGGSAACDAFGNRLLQLGDKAECRIIEVDTDALHRFRKAFPVLIQ